jgi:DNA-binding XRE family transcriptional regulator
MDSAEYASIGRIAVKTGELQQLREQLGLSRTAMAEMLFTSVITYTKWEVNPDTILWTDTSVKIGRFLEAARYQMQRLREDGVAVDEIIPLHLAATQLSIPQEVILKLLHEHNFAALDLGILGMWLYRDMYQQQIRDARG